MDYSSCVNGRITPPRTRLIAMLRTSSNLQLGSLRRSTSEISETCRATSKHGPCNTLGLWTLRADFLALHLRRISSALTFLDLNLEGSQNLIQIDFNLIWLRQDLFPVTATFILSAWVLGLLETAVDMAGIGDIGLGDPSKREGCKEITILTA